MRWEEEGKRWGGERWERGKRDEGGRRSREEEERMDAGIDWCEVEESGPFSINSSDKKSIVWMSYFISYAPKHLSNKVFLCLSYAHNGVQCNVINTGIFYILMLMTGLDHDHTFMHINYHIRWTQKIQFNPKGNLWMNIINKDDAFFMEWKSDEVPR